VESSRLAPIVRYKLGQLCRLTCKDCEYSFYMERKINIFRDAVVFMMVEYVCYPVRLCRCDRSVMAPAIVAEMLQRSFWISECR